MSLQAQTYSAHGKFLITGEYAVLAGVPALAIPLQLNQHLTVVNEATNAIHWRSYDNDGSLWLDVHFDKNLLIAPSDDALTVKLKEILKKALELTGKNEFESGATVTTRLDFNRTYGMGTSSTLIAMVAQWIGCDAFALQFATFGGSGYDIACATASQALVYTYHAVAPAVMPVVFNPSFTDRIYFVYLNRKQNSRESIARFDSAALTPAIIDQLTSITNQCLQPDLSQDTFESIMQRHERIISKLIGLQPVKERLFPDFTGTLKSLGGWGGDFIMAIGQDAPRYFKEKKYEVVYRWDELVLV